MSFARFKAAAKSCSFGNDMLYLFDYELPLFNNTHKIYKPPLIIGHIHKTYN